MLVLGAFPHKSLKFNVLKNTIPRKIGFFFLKNRLTRGKFLFRSQEKAHPMDSFSFSRRKKVQNADFSFPRDRKRKKPRDVQFFVRGESKTPCFPDFAPQF